MGRPTIIGLAAGGVLLAACVGKAPVSEEEGAAAAGYGRLFGRVQYTYNGEPTELGAGFLASHTVTLLLRQAGSDEVQYLQPERDGTFSWPLRPGHYALIGVGAGRSAGSYRESTVRRYMAPIQLGEAGSALYIGDIRVQSSRGQYAIEILDEYDETVKRMQPLLDAGKFRPVKALLRPERPPGRFKAIQPVCSPRWGLTCSETSRGVELVAPVGPGMTFPTTESLTPLLEWKPSTRKDVTYDVAIYESLSVENPFMNVRVNRMLGALAAYAEGLTEPRFVPATPLKPSRKYEWSVRLRSGDTVSTWSTTNFSLNLLIASKSESNQLFAFETPEK